MSKYIGYVHKGKTGPFPSPNRRRAADKRYVVAQQNDKIVCFNEGEGNTAQPLHMTVSEVRDYIDKGYWRAYARRPKWLKKKD